MVFLIAGILVAVAGVIAAGVLKSKVIAVVGALVGIVLIAFSCFYTQDVGEAVVIKNADGTIAKTDIEAGIGAKAPWQSKISFDIKGQQAQYKLDGKPTQENETVEGPTITVNTKDKLPVDVDIAIGYSVEPDAVEALYTEYKTEEVIFQRLISTTIKSVVKDAANPFTVDELIANREGYSKAIQERLEERLGSRGITIDLVSLHTLHPPQSTLDNITETQNVQQQLLKAEATTKVKEEEARQRVVEANGIAEANKALNDSLTDKVLQDKYIDTLKNAKSLVVVPDGSTPMVSVPQQ